MKDLLTYSQAALKTPWSEKTLRHHAEAATPKTIRLEVERLGSRTTRIKETKLRDWMDRKQRFAK